LLQSAFRLLTFEQVAQKNICEHGIARRHS
jgi:hypothetical protein